MNRSCQTESQSELACEFCTCHKMNEMQESLSELKNDLE